MVFTRQDCDKEKECLRAQIKEERKDDLEKLRKVEETHAKSLKAIEDRISCFEKKFFDALGELHEKINVTKIEQAEKKGYQEGFADAGTLTYRKLKAVVAFLTAVVLISQLIMFLMTARVAKRESDVLPNRRNRSSE